MTDNGGGAVRGWPIVGWAAALVGVLVAGVLLVAGTGPHGVQLLLRATAATSATFFLSAFTASALRRLWPSPLTGWLLANRRQLGVSFGVSHTVHLGAIWAAVHFYREEIFGPAGVDPVTRVAGSLAYVVLLLMVATSFDRTARWVGPRAWRILHTGGVYYLWFIFVVTYLGRATEAVFPAVFTGAMVGGMAVRAAAALQRRRARAPAPGPAAAGPK